MIFGTAVGDAVGLPREGLAPRRAGRMFGHPPLEHRLILGRGMVSDDTEHTCMVAQSLLVSGGEPRALEAELARRLKRWFLGIPAGTGLATLKSCLRLLIGVPPSRSGTFSAGNGPAMRVALLGLVTNDADRLRHLVRAQTHLTHTDPRAEEGALLVARAAGWVARRDPPEWDPIELLDELLSSIATEEFIGELVRVRRHLETGSSPREYADDAGMARGVGGYIVHTVPAALFCWLSHPGDFRSGVEAVISMGGDADTSAAIVGALAGAALGEEAIPSSWLNGLKEWPRDVEWMRQLADRIAAMAHGEPAEPMPSRWFGVLLRNPIFTAIVLCHGLRRLLPPY